MPVTIHPTAIVHPGAALGNDVEIGPYAIIEDKVTIGDRCRIESHAQILSHTTMGSDNEVFSFASVGGTPQDLKFQGEESYLVIGNNNSIREYVTLHRGTKGGGGVTKIGDNCLLMAYVHVAHDCTLGNNVILSNAAMLAGHIEIGDSAVIGGMSGVHQFVRIGECAFLGAMSGLGMDLPPYMLASGSRARLMGPNAIGLKRHGVTPEVISALRTAYKRIWRSEIPRKDALDEIASEFTSMREISALLEFIAQSQRGVLPAPKNLDEIENGFS